MIASPASAVSVPLEVAVGVPVLTPTYDALAREYEAGAPVEGTPSDVLGLDTSVVLYEGPISEEHEAWLMGQMSALAGDPVNPLHGVSTVGVVRYDAGAATGDNGEVVA